MNADAQDMIATIERIFTALGDNDHAGLNELFCADFHALRTAFRWTVVNCWTL